MEPTALQLTWFVLLGVLMAGYAILDGFDLGVGILHLFARKDTERRIFMSSIGPIWDGNEVWLVVFGGATFAAFPNAYAAAFSGFYLGFMLLLCCLIFRAVAMEFRSKRPSRLWRGAWDVAFSAASAAIAADDERNASNGLPWWMARGTLAIASTLSIGTTHSHGCLAKFAVASGRAISVQADSTRYAARNRKNVRHIQPLIRPCNGPSVLRYR